MTPLELIERLSVLFPPPRKHRHRYAGVMAPNSRLRSRVISSAGPAGALAAGLDEAARKMGLEKHSGQERQGDPDADPQTREPEPQTREAESDPRRRASRFCWAMLLARLYEVLPLLCPRCSSAMKVVAFNTQPEVIARILGHLGELIEPPTVAPAREVQPRLFTTPGNRGPPFSGHWENS